MRLLIAEDNMELASLLHECLISYFAADISGISIVHNGRDAVDSILKNEPDIVLLDIIMPELDGISVLREIKRLKPDKKPHFLILTAIGKDSLVIEATQLGADYFIQKPFNMQSIISLILQIQAQQAQIN